MTVIISSTAIFNGTIMYRTITPAAIEPCRDSYQIGKTSNDDTYRIIIDPCRSSIALSNKGLNSGKNDNQEIWVYDHCGSLVFRTNEIEFDLSFLRKGMCYFNNSNRQYS